MSLYYNRAGEPIGLEEWAKEMDTSEGGIGGRRVAEDTIEIDGFKVWVSTVWLGTDMSFGSGPPILFETVAFDQDDWDFRNAWRKEHGWNNTPPKRDVWPHDQEEERWHTEKEALAGHRKIVEAILDHTYHTDQEDS
jgi:hypothetical protein